MYPFDVILFDVGGVLLTNGWDHCERARVLEQFHLDVAEFEVRNPKPYAAWEIGAISVESYLDETVFYEPRGFSPQEFLAAICAQSEVLPDGALGILGELAAADQCLLGALNNEARETNEFRFNSFGLRKLFKVALSSCYLGLRKPDAAIYKHALDILGRPAERILFIDDRAGNVAGAQTQGMKAIQFESEETLRRELVSLGVL
ncbi:MAG: HAD-IA family hydrolase [Terracidiphilus sp.]|jgi:putative hydrolase of the HAD superfamily